MNEKLLSLPEEFLVANVPFNFYTTSEMLQRILEKPLEKKAGRNYGPPGTKRLIYFIDDMNMPEVSQYKHITIYITYPSYESWYDVKSLRLSTVL